MTYSVLERFEEKLLSKYRESFHINNLLEIIARELQDHVNINESWSLSNSIDDASGDNLDKIASLMGLVRPDLQEDNLFRFFGDWELNDDPGNHHGLSNDELLAGGYLSHDDGLPSKKYPGQKIGDDEFKELIQSHILNLGVIPSIENIYKYLVSLGCRCKITEDYLLIEIEPLSYSSMTFDIQKLIRNRGLRQAGVQLVIKPKPALEDV